MQDSEKLKQIPVVIMSSDGDEQFVDSCLQKGAKDYIVKPVRLAVSPSGNLMKNPYALFIRERKHFRNLSVRRISIINQKIAERSSR